MHQRLFLRLGFYRTSMKLSEWAERQGIHYQTAWKWWKEGNLPVAASQTRTGTILVYDREPTKASR